MRQARQRSHSATLPDDVEKASSAHSLAGSDEARLGKGHPVRPGELDEALGVGEGTGERDLRSRLLNEVLTRGRWLLGLLVLQSSSSFVLQSFTQLLQEHLVVTLFLTMLVGAGGNAGNQSAIYVIRALATSSVKLSIPSLVQVLKREAYAGIILATFLSQVGFLRVLLTNGGLVNAFAISLSLFMIVLFSVLFGTVLPFGLGWIGLDPAHAGTTIQVCMDVLGVFITCSLCSLVFGSSLGEHNRDVNIYSMNPPS
mmetsp:Transcript_6903/g.25449  ORF Transcript_6903/g.25449 Transcript_6903/m.25449 type:complete len:256 (-) Transcript_6903:1027-1794(-)